MPAKNREKKIESAAEEVHELAETLSKDWSREDYKEFLGQLISTFQIDLEAAEADGD